MSKSLNLAFIFTFVFLSSCKKQEVMVPSYLYLYPPQLVTKSDNSEGYASSKIEDVYVFNGGEFRGIYATQSLIPIQKSGTTKLRIAPGIKYNGLSEQRAVYQMFNYFEQDLNLIANSVDTIRPVFTYVENTKFPLIEDFDLPGMNLEYNPQYKLNGDTLVKDNSAEAWLPGKNSAKITLNSSEKDAFLEMYSKVFSNWPRFTPFFMELDYKCNVPFSVGLYVTDNQFVTTRVPLFIFNPKIGWNKLYLDLESEITQRGTDKQYRLYFRFGKGEEANPQIWIDNLKIIYLD